MNAKIFRFRGKMRTCTELAEIAAGMGSDVTARIICRRMKKSGLSTINAAHEAAILGPLQKKPSYTLLPCGREFTLREMEAKHGLSRSALGKRIKKTGKTSFTMEELEELARDARYTTEAPPVKPVVIRNINDVVYNPSPAEMAMLRI